MLPEVIKRVQKNIVPFGVGVGCFAVGTFLFLDDAYDFGLFSTPEHPSPIHHWWIGLILMLLGIFLMLVSVFVL